MQESSWLARDSVGGRAGLDTRRSKTACSNDAHKAHTNAGSLLAALVHAMPKVLLPMLIKPHTAHCRADDQLDQGPSLSENKTGQPSPQSVCPPDQY